MDNDGNALLGVRRTYLFATMETVSVPYTNIAIYRRSITLLPTDVTLRQEFREFGYAQYNLYSIFSVYKIINRL